MNFNNLPSRPVVKNQISAQADWDRWLYENHFKKLYDGDGLEWNLIINTQQLPDEQDWHQAKWIATYELIADVSAETFIKTGTLDATEDARIIHLIGERLVPLRMKRTSNEARGEKEAKDLLTKLLPDLRDSLSQMSLMEVKRSLIGRWVDETALFGKRENKSSW
jgi:hypothetical protein